MRNKLSTKQIDNAKSREKEYRICDGESLYLIIRPKGSRSWEFRFKRPSTRRYTYTGLGRYPDISLARARHIAQEYRRLLSEGIDPIIYFEEQKYHKKVNTFSAVADLWIESKRDEVEPKTISGNWRKLERHVFPYLGELPISDLRAPFVIGVLRPLEKAGKLDLIQRIISLINQIMVFSVNYGLIEINPLCGIGKVFKKAKVENNPALAPGELVELMSSLSDANLYLSTKGAIEFQLHTMTRPNEVAGARWGEIDSENNYGYYLQTG